MRRVISGVVLLGILGGGSAWVAALADQQVDPGAVKAFMRGKLDASQGVLEALVTEDFELMRQNAQRIRLMGRRAEWNVLKTPVYVQHSAEFQRATERLEDASKEESLDAASLAYLQLTFSCINCHKYVRSIKVAAIDPNLEEMHFAAALEFASGGEQ